MGRPRIRRGRRGTFAEGLRRARATLRLTQAEAARRLRVPWITLARWETGAVKPHPRTRVRVEAWIREATKGGNDGA